MFRRASRALCISRPSHRRWFSCSSTVLWWGQINKASRYIIFFQHPFLLSLLTEFSPLRLNTKKKTSRKLTKPQAAWSGVYTAELVNMTWRTSEKKERSHHRNVLQKCNTGAGVSYLKPSVSCVNNQILHENVCIFSTDLISVFFYDDDSNRIISIFRVEPLIFLMKSHCVICEIMKWIFLCKSSNGLYHGSGGCRSVTAETPVRSRASPCEIYGWLNDTARGCSLLISVPPYMYYSTSSQYSHSS